MVLVDVILLVLIHLAAIVILTVEEHHNIRVLLNGAGLSQVGQLGLMVLASPLGTTGQLGTADHRDHQVLSQHFQLAGNLGHLLHTVFLAGGGFDQAQIVDHNHIHIFHAPHPGLDLRHGDRRSIV